VTDPAPNGQPDPQQPDGGNNGGFTPPATQQELNRIISERVQRERAKFADYDEVKAAAAQIPELAQKVADAEASAADVPSLVSQQLRTHLVALHEIPAEDADLFLTASDPEVLLKQVGRLVGRSKPNGNHVPLEGKNSSPVDTDERQFAQELFKG
jgi:hypothetical protein